MPYMRLSIVHMRNIILGNIPRCPDLNFTPVKKVIGFDQAQLSAIDKWRRRQDPIPTVSEAIRKLVAVGLKAKTTEK